MDNFEIYWRKLVLSKNGNLWEFLEKLFLNIISYFYGLVINLRNVAYDCGWFKIQKASFPVISIGNISLGGSGKTTLAMWCAQILKENKRKPCVVSRGYRRQSSKCDIKIVSNGKEILANVEEAGDEPMLMAKKLKDVPIIVARDRRLGAQIALTQLEVNCAILDDGFQHRKLDRDLDIICLEPSLLEAPYLFPRGPLREKFSSLDRADFIAIKDGNEKMVEDFEKIFSYKMITPIGFFSYKNSGLKNLKNNETISIEFLKNKNVLSFSGLANPQNFENQLQRCGANLVGTERFPDHHTYKDKELNFLKEKSEKWKAILVTTEKDSVKLPLKFPAYVLEIEIDWKKGKEKLVEMILKSIHE